jgi:hypothetical protein
MQHKKNMSGTLIKCECIIKVFAAFASSNHSAIADKLVVFG